MRDHEQAMFAYACLAEMSWQKRQLAGRDRFLILTAAAACRAGWPQVAEQCRQMTLEHNARHLIGRHATVADALRDDGFQAFLRQLERQCPYEQAEHLLRAAGRATALDDDAGRQVLAVLGRASAPAPAEDAP